MRSGSRYQTEATSYISTARVVLLLQHGEQLVLFLLLLPLLESSLVGECIHIRKKQNKRQQHSYIYVDLNQMGYV